MAKKCFLQKQKLFFSHKDNFPAPFRFRSIVDFPLKIEFLTSGGPIFLHVLPTYPRWHTSIRSSIRIVSVFIECVMPFPLTVASYEQYLSVHLTTCDSILLGILPLWESERSSQADFILSKTR